MSATTTTATSARWSSRFAFVLAAAGSAVGLGNIWKFPYITGENGGGAFVLVYLVAIAAIGVPVMIGEVLIGRLGRRSPVSAYEQLAIENGASRRWGIAGLVALIAGLMVLSFYAVVAGWAVAYVFKAISGAIASTDPAVIGQAFGDLTGSPGQLLLWTTIVYLVSAAIVALGVNRGIERSLSILMPLMALLLIAMVGYAAVNGDMSGAISFMFAPDFSRLTTDGALVALGHAFFTLSLGAGIMIMYGAYLQRDISIGKAVAGVAIADTLVALLAGLAIFPIVFANGLEPGIGPGLVFQTLPLAFAQMPGGQLVAVMFFALLVVAALASTISMLEGMVVLLGERLGWSRLFAVSALTATTWTASLLTVFSFNIGSEWRIAGKNPFELIDYVASNVMLPLSGIAVALFAGWVIRSDTAAVTMGMQPQGAGFAALKWLLRVIAPALIALVFLDAMGWLN